MPSTTINVRFINQPKPGQRSGSVRDANGVYYGVPPNMLGMFRENTSYEIFYEESQGRDGRTYYNIKTVNPVGGPPQSSFPGVQNPLPRAASQHSAGPDKSEQIWVQGLVQAAIQAGAVNAGDTSAVIHAGKEMRIAYRAIFAPEPIPQPRPAPQSSRPIPQEPQSQDIPFDDEIPFA